MRGSYLQLVADIGVLVARIVIHVLNHCFRFFETGGLRLDLAGHFVTFSKIERASNYVHLWRCVHMRKVDNQQTTIAFVEMNLNYLIHCFFMIAVSSSQLDF